MPSEISGLEALAGYAAPQTEATPTHCNGAIDKKAIVVLTLTYMPNIS